MNLDSCTECGRPASEHHGFNARSKPDSCVCDVGSWGSPDKIPPACARYEGVGVNRYCNNCEHDEGCHSAAAPHPETKKEE